MESVLYEVFYGLEGWLMIGLVAFGYWLGKNNGGLRGDQND